MVYTTIKEDLTARYGGSGNSLFDGQSGIANEYELTLPQTQVSAFLNFTTKLLAQLPALSKARKTENKRFFLSLKRKPPKNLDQQLEVLDENAFTKINCLECANCCKTTGPLFTQSDIARIARAKGQKPGRFIETYLRIDEEGDYVLRELPCPFLGEDNYCSIYDIRPKACREYPHTRQRKFQNHADLHLCNVAICPAAYLVVEALKENVDF